MTVSNGMISFQLRRGFAKPYPMAQGVILLPHAAAVLKEAPPSCQILRAQENRTLLPSRTRVTQSLEAVVVVTRVRIIVGVGVGVIVGVNVAEAAVIDRPRLTLKPGGFLLPQYVGL